MSWIGVYMNAKREARGMEMWESGARTNLAERGHGGVVLFANGLAHVLCVD